MSREQFIDNLRTAARLLPPPCVEGGRGSKHDHRLASMLHGADLWLSPRSVEGFDPADFADLPPHEQEQLRASVDAFREIAQKVPSDKPATKAQSQQARQLLERTCKILRDPLLSDWLEAQSHLFQEVEAAARHEGWAVKRDEKDVLESLLGSYKAPRLLVRTGDQEVVFDPVARFGSGRRGIVDLVVMPTYETAYLLTYKDGNWHIVSTRGVGHSRPLTRSTLVNTIAGLRHRG